MINVNLELRDALAAMLSPARVLTRPIDRVAFASDASFYRLIPQAVVQPDSVDEICALFSFSHKHGIPLTFRAAGTSLSGQSVTDGILVDISKHWRQIHVEEGGTRLQRPAWCNRCIRQRLPAPLPASHRP